MTWKKSATGIVNLDFYLPIKMADLDDFSTDISWLQFIGQELGVEVYPTPKYHDEIAGKRIE